MSNTSNAASAVVPFRFENSELRVITRNNEPWFVAADLCAILGLKNPTVAVESLDADEKAKLNLGLPGGDTNVISESGFYCLVMRSRDAVTPGTVQHKFRKWVTAEVLPAIRKTGSYRQPGADLDRPDTLLIVAREFRAAVRMARAAGLRDAGAVLAADRLTTELTGFSPVALLDEDVADLLDEAL